VGIPKVWRSLLCLLTLDALAVSVPAMAQNATPSPRVAQSAPSADRAEVGAAATLVPFGTMTAIIVWRTPEAMQDGIALAKANAPAIEVYPLVSCIAESGAKVKIVDYGEWDKHYVVSVVEGPHTGCQGAVLNVNVRR
jgi:hypothetical protein